MTSQKLANWIYDHLPAHDGANRYDREWERGDCSARFYVGDKTNREISGFNLWLNKGKDTCIHLVWPASRISYSTFDSSKLQENWQPKKDWYFLRMPSEDNYHKYEWRTGFARGFFGRLCGWCFSYYDGHIEIWIRRHADDRP